MRKATLARAVVDQTGWAIKDGTCLAPLPTIWFHTQTLMIGVAQNHSFTAMAAYDGGPINFGGGDAPLRTLGMRVSGDFFEVMGVRPMVGRTFSPAEPRAGNLSAVILGYGLWQPVRRGSAAGYAQEKAEEKS